MNQKFKSLFLSLLLLGSVSCSVAFPLSTDSVKEGFKSAYNLGMNNLDTILTLILLGQQATILVESQQIQTFAMDADTSLFYSEATPAVQQRIRNVLRESGVDQNICDNTSIIRMANTTHRLKSLGIIATNNCIFVDEGAFDSLYGLPVCNFADPNDQLADFLIRLAALQYRSGTFTQDVLGKLGLSFVSSLASFKVASLARASLYGAYNINRDLGWLYTGINIPTTLALGLGVQYVSGKICSALFDVYKGYGLASQFNEIFTSGKNSFTQFSTILQARKAKLYAEDPRVRLMEQYGVLVDRLV